MPDRSRPDPALLTLLEGVSRSFYLSIRLLPPGLGRPVGLGYLLARASDTLADAPGAGRAERLALLDRFLGMVRGERPAEPIRLDAAETPQERQLLQALPACMGELQALDEADRADVLTVLGHITRGQRLDVERFGDASAANPASLADDGELDEYTYLVAGCVGEFWTRLGLRHVAGFATLPPPELMDLGKRYGMALQLVNVLRDEAQDLATGRRYLPAAREPWFARAREGLECGLRYSLALESRRMRVASALPALIGARTLALLRAAGPRAAHERIKVPRSEVRWLLLRVLLSLGSRARIAREFRDALGDNRPR
ncbi:squalene/phytoene synthase family protein [Ramlibacter sp. PS4R-6]|uniref:squalene/phytoene synthase family protein n=1 Tax=Ramlibacter sp. PS4R-6 TaxID=3133438 RepID=UPI0030B015D8